TTAHSRRRSRTYSCACTHSATSRRPASGRARSWLTISTISIIRGGQRSTWPCSRRRERQCSRLVAPCERTVTQNDPVGSTRRRGEIPANDATSSASAAGSQPEDRHHHVRHRKRRWVVESGAICFSGCGRLT